MADRNVELALTLATEQFTTAVNQASANIERALTGIEQKAGKTGATVDDSLAGAFRNLNIKPVAEIREEIGRLQLSYERLRASGASLQDLKRAKAALNEETKKLNAEMNKGTGFAGGLSNAFGGLRGVLGGLGIAAVGGQFLEANLAAERLQKALLAITGDSGAAASEMAFIRATVDRLGLSLESTAKGYIKFSAATKGTALEGAKTREIFGGVAAAMSKLGLTATDQERAFNALGQMMSKGTVTAEELKGQLGDVLPGAFQIAARAAGLTTAELGKLMEQGGLLAEDFLPAFSEELKKTFGDSQEPVKGLAAEMSRLGNQWKEAATTLGESGGVQILGAAMGGLNAVLMTVAFAINFVVANFVAFGKSLGLVAAAVATMNFDGLGEELNKVGQEAVAQVAKFAKLTGAAYGMEDAADKAGKASGTAAGQVGKLGAAAEGASGAAGRSSAGWLAVVNAYGKATEAAKLYVQNAKATADANNRAAEAAVKLSELTGNEAAQLRAKAEAATTAAAGSLMVADALAAESRTLNEKVNALKAEVAGQKEVSAEKQKAIAEAQQAAQAKQTEAEAARSNAESSRIAAEQAKLTAATYGDQTAQLQNLRAAYEEATARVRELKAAEESGKATAAEVTEATEAQAIASKKYADALRDTAAAADRNLSVQQAGANVMAKGIDLEIMLARTAGDIARAKGDEEGARKANVRILELEIQKKILAARVADVEAQAAAKKAALIEKEAIASGTLTDAKKAEIEALKLAAEAKRLDADIASVAANGAIELADATKKATEASGGLSGSIGGATAAVREHNAAVAETELVYDQWTGKMERVATSSAKMASALAQSSRDMSGNVVEAQGFDKEWAKQFLSGQGLDEKDSQLAAENFFDSKGNAINFEGYGSLAAALKAAADALKSGTGMRDFDLGRNTIGQNVGPGGGFQWVRGENERGFNGLQQLDASNEAKDAIDRMVRERAGRSAQAQPETGSGPSRTIRLELAGPGGSPVNLYADDEASAQALVDTLRRAGMRVGR